MNLGGRRKRFFGVKRQKSVDLINESITNDENLTEEEKIKKMKPNKGRQEKRKQRM